MSAGTPFSEIPGINASLADPFLALDNTPGLNEVNAQGGMLSASSYAGGAGGLGSASGGDAFDFRPVSADGTYPAGSGGYSPNYMPSAGGGGGGIGGPNGTYTYPSSSGGTPAQAFGKWDAEQMTNAQTIVQAGKDVGASSRDIQIALMAAMTESTLHNYSSGSGDSVGLFQQKSAWGNGRTDPYQSAKMFFTGGASGERGLLDIPNRDHMSLGDAAQAVQVSAYPGRYATHEADAQQVLDNVGPTAGMGPLQDTSYVGPFRPKGLYAKAQALTQSGDNYYRECQRVAGLISGRAASGYATASAAWNHFVDTGTAHQAGTGGGATPPVGAWLYYDASTSAGHVAVYLGNGKVASTDVFGNGKVGIGDMSELTNGAWHLHYLGWAAPWGQGDPKPIPGAAKAAANSQSAPTGNPEAPWRQTVVKHAQKYLGTPYKWGGRDFTGIDSSGFVRAVYNQVGVALPAATFQQAATGDMIPLDKLRPGDLVVWDTSGDNLADKVGVYMGGNAVIEGNRPGSAIQVSSIDSLNRAAGVSMASVVHDPFSYGVASINRAPVAHASPQAPGAPGGVSYLGGHTASEPSATPSGGYYHPPAPHRAPTPAPPQAPQHGSHTEHSAGNPGGHEASGSY